MDGNNIILLKPYSELEDNNLYVNSTTQRCRNKIFKTFSLKIFSICHLSMRISLRIFEKIRNGPNEISQGWGETDSRKKPEIKKSRGTVTFIIILSAILKYRHTESNNFSTFRVEDSFEDRLCRQICVNFNYFLYNTLCVKNQGRQLLTI